MRILVAGGAGYIGSHTCVALLDAGHEVVVLDDLSNSRHEVINRIRQITQQDAAFDSFHPEMFIHFAGLKAVGESVQCLLRYYEWNVSGSIALFQAMAKKEVKKLVFSSSANVYGNSVDVPIRETAPIVPTNPYGRSKAMIEQLLGWKARFGLEDMCRDAWRWQSMNPQGYGTKL